jgi:hypothetical protein
MAFDNNSSFDRLWKLVGLCRKYNLEHSVYEVLDPIWANANNQESVILLYQSDIVVNIDLDHAYQEGQIIKTECDDEVIGKLHDMINNRIEVFKIVDEVWSD